MPRTLLLIAALALTVLASTTADARTRHGRHHVFHHRGYYATSDYYHHDRQLVGTR